MAGDEMSLLVEVKKIDVERGGDQYWGMDGFTSFKITDCGLRNINVLQVSSTRVFTADCVICDSEHKSVGAMQKFLGTKTLVQNSWKKFEYLYGVIRMGNGDVIRVSMEDLERIVDALNSISLESNTVFNEANVVNIDNR